MATTKFLYDSRGHIIREFVAQDTDDDGTYHVHTRVNADPILRRNKMLQENHAARGDMKHVASIPITVYEKALREGWAEDKAAWKRYLNDPDNRAFRVWEGRV